MAAVTRRGPAKAAPRPPRDHPARPESAGGEDFEAVSRDEFVRRRAIGGFRAVAGRRMACCYGIPLSVAGRLARGRDVHRQRSRAALPAARLRFPTCWS